MKIQNLVGIMSAKLANEPQISQVENFCFEASKAKSGDCFFAQNELEAKLAVNNGAYAIVGNIDPFDNEVAFLQIKDLQTAILRLIRYFITANKIIVLNVNSVQSAILSLFNADFVLCDENLKNILNYAMSAKNKILAIKNSSKNISFESFDLTEVKSVKSSSLSLFYSDFVYNDIRYNIALPSIFVGEFCAILAFFYAQNCSFKLKDFKDFESFKPLFVGRENIPVNSSERAFICINDKDIFEFCKKRLNVPFFENICEPKVLKFERYALILADYKELFAKLNVVLIEESLF